ncbi:hypothetical protein [Streptomyces kanamyceticus]|uniref:Uncharacterized protein n=1 Tax=Streptomyces kanamyceticus TaxID=1967 RepID=A0A5J6GG54_STRKN|nr:hypothetical protein [Streptomyces kanamyceticus]QEU92875.1 hypothetical protein CP970_19905 [Streptomyces kanamyceticus]
MSNQPWTIDSIAHAIPHPELRQNFLREVHLTPRTDLEAVLDRWERFVRRWTQEEAPKIEQVRAYYQEHGTLPPDYESAQAEQAQQSFDDWRARMRAAKKAGSDAA